MKTLSMEKLLCGDTYSIISIKINNIFSFHSCSTVPQPVKENGMHVLFHSFFVRNSGIPNWIYSAS